MPLYVQDCNRLCAAKKPMNCFLFCNYLVVLSLGSLWLRGERARPTTVDSEGLVKGFGRESAGDGAGLFMMTVICEIKKMNDNPTCHLENWKTSAVYLEACCRRRRRGVYLCSLQISSMPEMSQSTTTNVQRQIQGHKDATLDGSRMCDAGDALHVLRCIQSHVRFQCKRAQMFVRARASLATLSVQCANTAKQISRQCLSVPGAPRPCRKNTFKPTR